MNFMAYVKSEIRWLHGLRRWWGPAVLALGWHVVWWNWLQVEQPRSRFFRVPLATVRSAPLPAQHGALEWREPVSAMSPLLFALPIRGGFSEPTERQKVGVRPPLAPLMPATCLATERLAKFPVTGGLWPPAQLSKDDVSAALQAFPLKMDSEPVFGAPSVPGLWAQIETDGALADEEFTISNLPKWPPALRTQMWETVVFLDIGPDGFVRRLLLESRSPSEAFNEALERYLRTRAFSSGRYPGHGRLRIRAMRAPTTEPVAERTRP